MAEGLYGGAEHFLENFLVLFFLAFGEEALPGKRAASGVNKDEAEGFEIIAARLLDAQMSVETGVPYGAS